MSLLQQIRSRFWPTGKPPKSEDTPDGQSIEQRGWRQWSCVSPADITATLLDASPDLTEKVCPDSRLLIVTQDCDLVHHSFDNEPSVEACFCTPLPSEEQVDGNQTAGKNPRTLVVLFSIDGEERWFRIRSNGKKLFPRQVLAPLTPDQSVVIQDDATAILQRWLVNRIMRTAFPEAFNARTKKSRLSEA